VSGPVGESPATSLIEAAAERGLRIAVAESLTGGLLAAELVGVPGASRVFSGGVVAYDTALKRSLLGVDAGLLRDRGPVDEQVARQMARGARRACAVPAPLSPEGASLSAEGAPLSPEGAPLSAEGAPPREADLGIATTGVAGPDPDPQTGQPAGTVWVAVSGPRGERAQLLDGLAGLDRAGIRAATVRAAIELAMLEATAAAPAPRQT
jgi:nicotinamide-nucleotide amidase